MLLVSIAVDAVRIICLLPVNQQNKSLIVS